MGRNLLRKILHWLIERIFKDGKKRTIDKDLGSGNRGDFKGGVDKREGGKQ